MNLAVTKAMIGRFIVENKAEISVYAGIALMGSAVVSAIKATPKALNAIENNREKRKEFDYRYADKVDENGMVISSVPDDVKKRDLVSLRLKGAWNVSKHYIPSALQFAGGTGLVLYGFNIVKSERAAMATLAAASVAKLNDYRSRVVDDAGEEKDRQYFYGLKEVEREETYIDKNGKEKTRKIKELVEDTENPIVDGVFSFKIGGENQNYIMNNGNQNKELVERWLNIMEADLNNRLCRNGVVTVADVLEELGVTDDECVDGLGVNDLNDWGWIRYGASGEFNSEKYTGDNYISFGDHITIDYESPITGEPQTRSYLKVQKNSDHVVVTLNCSYIRGMRIGMKDWIRLKNDNPEIMKEASNVGRENRIVFPELEK